MPYYAHSGTVGEKHDWQLLADHSRSVAASAAQLAKPLHLEKAAYIAGLFHDLGKYNPAFQRRLEGVNLSVDHSTAGAAVLMAQTKGHDGTIAELCAYAILGHHAGLPDKLNDTAACFEHRVKEFKNSLDSVWEAELSHDLIGFVPEKIMQTIRTAGPHACFDISVVVRMIFSCLVDADFRDTEAFYVARENREVDRDWPSLESLLPDFLSSFDAALAAKPKSGELNALRSNILSHVRNKAAEAPGLFTLTVPTGGGKTLASLGFALDHAKLYGHRRIIFAIPFTSIVDQTATIFGQILGHENILEHHSAIECEGERSGGAQDGKAPQTRDRMRLAMEDWAAPVVVTTNVQLFESLFAARTTRARKLHNIAGSIIILDEAQTIPRHLLKPCIRMLDSLARLFSCTIVLCTATQPALERTEAFKDGLSLPVRELAPEPQKLYERLKRTEIRFAGDIGNADLVAALRNEPQALIIVNSRKHAFELYNEAQAAGLEGLIHLTTRQYAAHRRTILDDIRRRLKDGRVCRVIATSLIEAGVDVDFPKAWRAKGGLEQIIQAAGRVNREGTRRREDSIVTVFTAPDYPPPAEVRSLTDDMDRALKDHWNDPQSLAAIREYFGEVYWRMNERLDGKSKDKAIIPRLRISSVGTDFAFRSIAADFRMIESGMEPVIVTRDAAAQKAVNELSVAQIPSGRLARELQVYLVQVPPAARRRLIECGHVTFVAPNLRADQFAVLQTPGLYREDVGLMWEDAEYLAAESTMI